MTDCEERGGKREKALSVQRSRINFYKLPKHHTTTYLLFGKLDRIYVGQRVSRWIAGLVRLGTLSNGQGSG